MLTDAVNTDIENLVDVLRSELGLLCGTPLNDQIRSSLIDHRGGRLDDLTDLSLSERIIVFVQEKSSVACIVEVILFYRLHHVLILSVS